MTEAPDLFDSKKLTQPVGTVEVHLQTPPALHERILVANFNRVDLILLDLSRTNGSCCPRS
jgi:hypothetical protein